MAYMSILQASDPKKDCDKTEKMLKESEKADTYQALQQIRVVAHNRRRTFKVIVLGDPGVGKTCLTFRFCNGRFPSNSTPTIGVDFREKIIDLDGETLRAAFPFDVRKLRNDVIERLEKYHNSYPRFITLIIRSLTLDYAKSY
ncbi:Ras-related protein Rab-33B [Trichinella pseudospiralis]|uniref:Ras-related protein Rab-33B n=1 Tax=Trichinella pseudospiralis TaxID=6337 RepID=A0A0V1ES79_TRIPS|nr:Ras-related protein Rab-33B [Trichinella pseudospiralis]